MFLAASAQAQPQAQLEETQAELSRAEAKSKELGQSREALEEELRRLRQSLIKLASDMQEAQKRKAGIEEKLGILRRQQDEKTAEVEAGQKRLQSLIAASVRLSRSPPEAAVLMPGDFEQTTRAARVMASLTQSIKQEAEALAQQLRELESLQATLAREKEQADAVQAELQATRKALDKDVAKRRELSRVLNSEQAEARKRVAELSRKASDLRELMAGLEATKNKQNEVRASGLKNASRAKGDLRLPVQGSIIRRFGEFDGRNTTSKGMTIKANTGAQVVAPFDGEVVFAGPFLDYGRMLILRHKGDVHTMLSGLARLDASVGDFLLEGEPIGAMGNSARGAELYVELRESNHPVDPAPWFKK